MKLQLLLTIATLCVACHNADNNYEIDIHCPDCVGATVSLWQYQDNELSNASEAVFEHGRAVFKGNVSEPQLMYLFVEGARDYFPIFVENSDIDIDYVFARPSRSVVTGSVCHKKFSDFLQSYSAYSDKGTGIDKMIENAEENADTLMLQRLTENLRVLEHEKVEFQRQYVVQNINSPVAAYILSTDLMHKLDISELDSITALFPNEIKGSIYLKQVAEYRASMPNDTASQNNEPL